MFRVLIKFIVFIVEKVIAAFTLVAAFVSVAQQGGLLERMLGSLVALYGTFYGFGVAYAKNEQFRDVWARFTEGFDKALEAAAQNIEKDPHMVLFVFIATIVCFKLAAWILKTFRKGLLKRRPKAIKAPKRPARPQHMQRPTRPTPPSPTYDKLYEPPEVSPSTSAQIDKLKEE